MNDQTVLEAQLREWMDSVEQQGALSKVGIFHCTLGMPPGEIHAFQDGNPAWKNPAQMADAIDRAARRVAQGHSGAQSFEMRACFGGAPIPARSLGFIRMGVLSYGQGAMAGTDPPNAVGQTAQAMRLTEQQAQLGVRMIETADASKDRTIARLEEELREKTIDQRETRIAFLDLHRKFLEFQTNKNLEMLQFMRSSGERREFIRMTPAILNAISSHEIFPMQHTDSELLRGLVAAGDDKEIDAEVLRITERDPTKGAALSARIKEMRAEREEERAELKRMARNTEPVSLEDALDEVGGAPKAPSLVNGHTNGHALPEASTAKNPASQLPSADVDMAWDLPQDRTGLREKIEGFVRETARELDVTEKWEGDRAFITVPKGMAKGTAIEVLLGDQLRVRIKLEGLAKAARPDFEKRLREAGKELFQ